MKKTLIIATTVYHVIVAIQMKRTILRSHAVDLILGDETPNAEHLIKNIEKANLFSHVYFVKMNDYNKSQNMYSEYSSLDYAAKKYYDIKKMFTPFDKYDIYMVPFFHHFHMNLYSFLKRFINPAIRVYLYEEGLAIYSSMGILMDKLKKEYSEETFYRIFRYGRMLKEIRGIVTFNPQLLQWGKEYKKIKIPRINISDSELKSILNTVFDYHGEYAEMYNKKVIFFEEAKHTDGLAVNDVSIVNQLAEVIGKENILIKLHPRSTQNRFATFGYETNNNTLIPWEVLFMNHNMKHTLFVSTASSSIVHPVILFGEKVRAMFLFKMVHSILPEELQIHQNFIENVIVKNDADCFYLPRTRDDIKKIIEHLELTDGREN